MVDIPKIIAECDKRILSCVDQNNEILAKMTVSITSTLSRSVEQEIPEIHVGVKTKNRTNLIAVAVLSHYIDENVASYLRMSILDLPEVPEFSLAKFIAKSKRNLELYLIDIIEVRGTRFLFGNMLDLNKLLQALRSIFAYYINDLGNPVPLRQIGVGYRDKGHLPNPHEWLPTTGICLTELHNKIESNRDKTKDFESLLEGLLY